jgi:hypothetical protein
VLTEEQLERLSPPVPTISGRIVFDGTSETCGGAYGLLETNRYVSLLEDGRVDSGFGFDGGLPHPRLGVVALTVDARGRLLVLGRYRSGEEEPEDEWRVRRLLPNGSPDPTFGRNGTAVPSVPVRGTLTDLAVDRRGRVTLAGYWTNWLHQRFTMLLTQLTSSGHREPRFGGRGFTRTEFVPANAVGLQASVDSKGRVLVGGTTSDLNPLGEGISGLAFARYLGGR